MRNRYLVHHPDHAHFVTCTIVNWLPVFTIPGCGDIVLNSLKHCREHKSLNVYAWVVLDNHFHAILAAPDLSGVLRDLKSFTAAKILDQLALKKGSGYFTSFSTTARPTNRPDIKSGRRGRIRRLSRATR